MKLLLKVLVLVSLLLFLAVLGVLFYNFILLMAMQDTCKLIKPSICVFFSLLADLGWNKYLCPYIVVSWWHYICWIWYEWASCILWLTDFHHFLVSRKGMDPSALVVSAVNFIFSSIELMWLKNSSLCCASKMTKVSSTNLFHRLEGCGADSRASISNFSIKMWATMGLSGDCIAAPSTCS